MKANLPASVSKLFVDCNSASLPLLHFAFCLCMHMYIFIWLKNTSTQMLTSPVLYDESRLCYFSFQSWMEIFYYSP